MHSAVSKASPAPGSLLLALAHSGMSAGLLLASGKQLHALEKVAKPIQNELPTFVCEASEQENNDREGHVSGAAASRPVNVRPMIDRVKQDIMHKIGLGQ
jgi:hypothetical protein